MERGFTPVERRFGIVRVVPSVMREDGGVAARRPSAPAERPRHTYVRRPLGEKGLSVMFPSIAHGHPIRGSTCTTRTVDDAGNKFST